MAAFTLTPSQTLSSALIGPRAQSVFVSIMLVLGGSLLIAASAQLALRLPSARADHRPDLCCPHCRYGAGLPPRGAGGTGLSRRRHVPARFAEFRTWAHPFTMWTAGYLVGFVGAAWLTGWLAERGWDRRPVRPPRQCCWVCDLYPRHHLARLYVRHQYEIAGTACFGCRHQGFAHFLIGDGLKLLLALLAFLPPGAGCATAKATVYRNKKGRDRSRPFLCSVAAG